MKKIFTFFVALVAFAVSARAQATIILEAHNVWDDGTGYQLLLDADHSTYGTTIPETGPLTTSGDADASVYAQFEYKIPTNADGSLTTQNMVMDGTATIEIPAGTYDYVVVNPTPDDRVWIASGTDSRGDDYTFENGKIYHFSVALNGNNDLVTLTVTTIPTEPTIIVSPEAVAFGTVILGNSANQTLSVSSYEITSGITATVEAPFSVSTDGTTFATTATLAAEGGSLYVRYTPETVGSDNGTLTLAAGDVTTTVALTGVALDCSNNPIPYIFNFDNDAMASCWESIDANGDGKLFQIVTGSAYAYYNYSSTEAANDYLVSPVFALDGNQLLSFDYRAASTSYPERFEVLAWGADTIALTNPIDVTTATATTQYIDLSELNGNYKIVFHCISDANMYNFYISNFKIDINGTSMIVNPEAIDFAIVPMNTTSDAQTVEMTCINVTDPVTLTTTAPFEISLDGASYAATATIPASTESVVNHTVYVRFAPTAVGDFSENLTIAAGEITNTVALTGSSVDCSTGIDTLPFTEDFDSGVVPPTCWTVNDPASFFFAQSQDGSLKVLGMQAADVLITPEIKVNSAMTISFDYLNDFGTAATAPTYFRIGYSTTDNNIENFTWQGEQLCSVDEFTSITSVLPEGTKYAAIQLTQLGSGLYYGIFEMPDAMYVDNFTLTALTEPTMLVSDEAVSFGQIVFGNPSAPKTVSVTGALLTDEIAVAAPANFEISSNGTSYGSSLTLPVEGGTIYVRYNPAAVGSHNGNMTVTSGTTTKNIALNGSAIDCSAINELPYEENFESGFGCWAVNQVNPTATWTISAGEDGNWAFVNYDVEDQNEDLISPSFNFKQEYRHIYLKFDFNTSYYYLHDGDGTGEQHNLLIYVSTDGGQTYSATPVYNMREDEPEFANFTTTNTTVDLSAFKGNSNVKIKFNYFASYGATLAIDNINLSYTTGIEENEASSRVYPNPAFSVVNVEATSSIDRIEIFNVNGQKINDIQVGDNNTTINTANLSNGLYMMKIYTENGVSNQKFTVVK